MQRLCFLYFEFNRFSIKNSRSSVLETPAIFVYYFLGCFAAFLFIIFFKIVLLHFGF